MPHIVDRLHQDLNIRFLEPPTEVALCGRVRDPLGPQGVEVVLVIAPQLNVFQTPAAAETVVGNVQYMIRLVVGQVSFEQLQAGVDLVDQSHPPGQLVHGANAAGPQGSHSTANVVMNIAGRHHGFGLLIPVPLAQPPLDSPLAIAPLPASILIHLKCLLSRTGVF